MFSGRVFYVLVLFSSVHLYSSHDIFYTENESGQHSISHDKAAKNINKLEFYPKDSISCPCFSTKRDQSIDGHLSDMED